MRKGPGCLTGPFTKKDERLGPYKKPLTERVGPYGKGRSLREGFLQGWPFTKKDEEGYGKAWALTGNPLRGGTVLTKRAAPYGKGRGALRVPSQRRTTKRLMGRLGPYGKPVTERDDSYEKGRSLRESPLREWLPLQKRTAYGKLWGEILPELGGNFRLCAVDQKRPFFPRAGPFLAFLPFKEAYGKAGPYGALEPAALNAATLAAGKCGARGSLSLGFRVQGLGFRVQGLGFRFQGLGFRVQGLGFRFQGLGFRDQGLGFRVQGLGFRVQGLGFRFQGLGFRVQGLGFRFQGLGFRDQGLGFRVQGLGFRVKGFELRVLGSRVRGLGLRV